MPYLFYLNASTNINYPYKNHFSTILSEYSYLMIVNALLKPQGLMYIIRAVKKLSGLGTNDYKPMIDLLVNKCLL